MIMMGPKKDRGAMIVSIMEKLKGNGEKVEEFKEEKSDKPDYEEGYKASVDEMFEALIWKSSKRVYCYVSEK
jgi:hypothetical protein